MICGFGVQKHGVCLMRLCPSENTLWIGWEKMQIGAGSQKAQPLPSKTRASLSWWMGYCWVWVTVAEIDSNQEKIICKLLYLQSFPVSNENVVKDRRYSPDEEGKRGRRSWLLWASVDSLLEPKSLLPNIDFYPNNSSRKGKALKQTGFHGNYSHECINGIWNVSVQRLQTEIIWEWI